MDIHETIRDIKAQFRLFMNGAVSQSMREQGIDYKLNFGIELPRLKEISLRYEKNHALAQALWKENVRECKILASMLQPIDSFLPEIADMWVETVERQEIAELTCMNLFQHLPYASEKAFQWMADEREFFQVCGFLTLARLIMKNECLEERAENEFLDQAMATLCNLSESYRAAHASFVALRAYAICNASQSGKVLKQMAPLAQNEDERLRNYYALLQQELKGEGSGG